MAVNDPNDPEISVLAGVLEEYRCQYNLSTASMDRASVEHLYQMDEDFTAYDVAPPLEGYKGWSQYGAAWSRVLQKYSDIRFVFLDAPRIFRKGDVAWISVSADWAGTSRGGDAFAKRFRLTLILVRGDDGRWRITHEHGSAPRTFTLAGGEVV